MVWIMRSCFFDATQTLETSNQPTQPVIVFLLSLWKKNFETPLKSCQMWKAIRDASWMNDFDWLKGIYAVVDWLYIHM